MYIIVQNVCDKSDAMLLLQNKSESMSVYVDGKDGKGIAETGDLAKYNAAVCATVRHCPQLSAAVRTFARLRTVKCAW